MAWILGNISVQGRKVKSLYGREAFAWNRTRRRGAGA